MLQSPLILIPIGELADVATTQKLGELEIEVALTRFIHENPWWKWSIKKEKDSN